MQLPLGEAGCYRKAVSNWPSLSDLLTDGPASIGLVGAPLAAGSVTPGRCDLAPALLRQTLRRIGRYDVETTGELSTAVRDRGDVQVAELSIEEATGPISDAVAASVAEHALTLVIGGNNAVTRPAALGLRMPLERVGLITLDAHFDMRDLDRGLSNGNPVRALIADGLPGTNIAQIGLASFANTAAMHRDAVQGGSLVITMGEVRAAGVEVAIERALAHVSQCTALVIDCDIDVIDRAQMPGAPGARPGGMQVADFFRAVRLLAQDKRTRVIDLTEWDPPLDSTDLSALTAGRWLAECIAGFELR